VKVKLDKSSFPYKIAHYEFTIDGVIFTFQPYQILHGKYPDPNDPFVGIGIPQTIPVWIDSDNYAMEYNRKAELLKVFEGINKKQKEHVLAGLPKATGVEKTLDQLFDLKEWIGITVDLATPILTSLTRDEATAALAMIGANHEDILADSSVQSALDRGISQMARTYTETTLDQLKTVLSEKLTQPGGTNLDELTNAVDGVYSSADDRRNRRPMAP